MLFFSPEIPMNSEEFRLLRDFVYQHCGLHFTEDSKYLLEKRLGKRLQHHGLKSFKDYFYLLRYGQQKEQELSEVIDVLTTNETYFFREPGHFDMIRREIEHAKAGRGGRIAAKMNSLVDEDIIRALYAASQAGVRIRLNVRGVCCLRPGIPGISDRITVRSIVGQFLEHSRIYYFENGGTPEVYMGSADLMERNLDRRVEVLCPISDPAMRQLLRDAVLEVLLSDTDRAWMLQTEGSYVRATPPPGVPPLNSQKFLLEWYAAQHEQ